MSPLPRIVYCMGFLHIRIKISILAPNMSLNISVAHSLAPLSRRPVASSIAFSLALALGSATATPAIARERPDFPAMKFQDKSRGAVAVQRLGSNLDKVAEWYGMTPERLANILSKDHDAWLDEAGHLLFIDSFLPAPDESGAADGSGTVLDPGPYPPEETFRLHSKPNSQRIIYLDFDGHTVTGSAWLSGATIIAPAFSLDADTSTSFSPTELSRIQYIWQRVAEDFAPFDVDVTTEAPPVAPDGSTPLLDRASSSDQYYGARAVITHSSIGVCTGCGGVAYVGVFDWYSSTNPDNYQPAWVFYDRLGPGNEKYVAEAISHEIGHEVGLAHDGTSGTSYYAGQGSGTTGWAPIMGVGYYQPVVQFSRGEYAGANNLEDDFAVIQTNGVPLRADAAGNAKETAAPLAGATASGAVTVNQGGIIESRTDLDYFSLASGGGSLQVTANPGLRSPNMDISLRLLDAAGTVVAASNPPDALSATLSVNVPAGGYYLEVKGAGYGDPATNGYSDYASVGRYVLSGNFAASNSVAPVADASATPTSGYAPLASGFSSNGSNDPDGTIVSYSWSFGDGASSTDPNPLHTYNAVGTYTATLTVTDNQGLTDSSDVSISVVQDPAAITMHVSNIGISLNSVRKGKTTSYQCVASVSMVNSPGNLVSGATVNGAWSGITSSTASATTNASGVATFTSPKSSSPHGTCTLTATGASKPGWTYAPNLNVETSDSLNY
jgi:PKD repeat protein